MFENQFFKIEDMGNNGVLHSLSEIADIALPVVNPATAAKMILMLKVTAKADLLDSKVDLLTACDLTAHEFKTALSLSTGYRLKEPLGDDYSEHRYERHTVQWFSGKLRAQVKNTNSSGMLWNTSPNSGASLYSHGETITGNFQLPKDVQLNISANNYIPTNALLAKGTVTFGTTQYNFTLTINESGIYSLAPDHHVEAEIEEALVRAFPFLKGLFTITINAGDTDAQPTTTF